MSIGSLLKNLQDTTVNLFKSQSKDSFNTKAIDIRESQLAYLLCPKEHITNGIKSKLLITKINCKIEEITTDERLKQVYSEYFNEKKNILEHAFSAFIGLISVPIEQNQQLYRKFLVFVNEVKQASKIDEKHIYSIESISYLAINNQENFKEVNDYLAYIEKILSYGHYYSYSYPLTITKQNQNKEQIQQFNRHFFWNYNMMYALIKAKVQNSWLVQVIQGYVGSFSTTFKDKQKLNVFLISRRSCLRGGTRYIHRGVDSNGNAANFVESELIVFFKKFVCSHVQTRGSAPFPWKQESGISQAVNVEGTIQQVSSDFMKHIQQMHQDYNKIYCINLMQGTKNTEKILINQFELLINMHSSETKEFLKYMFFDYHTCFNLLNASVREMKDIIQQLKFFALDQKNNKISSQQIGVTRINCLDCMDRTNVYMSKVSMLALNIILLSMDKNLVYEYGSDVLQKMDEDSQIQDPLFAEFKNLWAENGDRISQFYAGTSAATTQVTKTGKQGVFGGLIDSTLRGVVRFYNQNFEDFYKQECIDIITNGDQDLLDKLQYQPNEQQITSTKQQEQSKQNQYINRQMEGENQLYEIHQPKSQEIVEEEIKYNNKTSSNQQYGYQNNYWKEINNQTQLDYKQLESNIEKGNENNNNEFEQPERISLFEQIPYITTKLNFLQEQNNSTFFLIPDQPNFTKSQIISNQGDTSDIEIKNSIISNQIKQQQEEDSKQPYYRKESFETVYTQDKNSCTNK